MATYDSIALGKAKGRLGNVSFSTIKGQSIVKSLPVKMKRIQTPAMIKGTEKLTIGYSCYYYSGTFFNNLRKLSSRYETNYNVFVRIFKNNLPAIKPTNPMQALVPLMNSKIGYCPNIEPYKVYRGHGNLYLSFKGYNNYFFEGCYLTVLFWKDNFDYVMTKKIKIYRYIWNTKNVIIPDDSLPWTHWGMYFYSENKKYLSTIKFGFIENL